MQRSAKDVPRNTGGVKRFNLNHGQSMLSSDTNFRKLQSMIKNSFVEEEDDFIAGGKSQPAVWIEDERVFHNDFDHVSEFKIIRDGLEKKGATTHLMAPLSSEMPHEMQFERSLVSFGNEPRNLELGKQGTLKLKKEVEFERLPSESQQL